METDFHGGGVHLTASENTVPWLYTAHAALHAGMLTVVLSISFSDLGVFACVFQDALHRETETGETELT